MTRSYRSSGARSLSGSAASLTLACAQCGSTATSRKRDSTLFISSWCVRCVDARAPGFDATSAPRGPWWRRCSGCNTRATLRASACSASKMRRTTRNPGRAERALPCVLFIFFRAHCSLAKAHCPKKHSTRKVFLIFFLYIEEANFWGAKVGGIGVPPYRYANTICDMETFTVGRAERLESSARMVRSHKGAEKRFTR